MAKKYLIGGFHAIQAALEQGQLVSHLWLASQRHDQRTQQLTDMASQLGAAIHNSSMEQLDKKLTDVNHQGFVAEFMGTDWADETALDALLAKTEKPWLLALDQIQDPHNLGACLRSAAAAGVSAVIAPKKRAAGLTAAVHKVAVGGASRVPFIQVTNLARTLTELKNKGFWLTGLAGEATQTLYQVDLSGPVVMVMGGEAKGLRQRTRQLCDQLARIPMHNNMESLNVSVAAGIALFEALRQRQL